MIEQNLDTARKVIAAKLRDRRIEIGMSQKELAEKIGIEQGTVSRMESGRFWINMKYYVLICNAIGIVPVVQELDGRDFLVSLQN